MMKLAKVDEIPVWGYRFTYQQGAAEEEGILLCLADGEIRAYKNECRHLPMRLDAREPHDIWDEAARHLQCCSHGARFRVTDGLCVSGPCEGERLEQLPIVISNDMVWLPVESDG